MLLGGKAGAKQGRVCRGPYTATLGVGNKWVASPPHHDLWLGYLGTFWWV